MMMKLTLQTLTDNLSWTLIVMVSVYYRQQILRWLNVVKHTFTRDAG